MLAGQVVAAYGRHYLVETGDGSRFACFPRGKKSVVACGDRVTFARTADEQGVIEKVEARSTLFARSVAHRQKLIAANVSQLAIVVAAEPSFSEELINRGLVAAEDQGMRVLILLNKCDLKEAARLALARLEPYAQAGYRVIELSALEGAERGWLILWLLLCIASGLGLAGWRYARRGYRGEPSQRALRLSLDALRETLFIERFYDVALIRPLRRVSRWALVGGIETWLIDRVVVSGGSGLVRRMVWGGLRRLQNGRLQSYALLGLLTVLVIVTWMVVSA